MKLSPRAIDTIHITIQLFILFSYSAIHTVNSELKETL